MGNWGRAYCDYFRFRFLNYSCAGQAAHHAGGSQGQFPIPGALASWRSCVSAEYPSLPSGFNLILNLSPATEAHVARKTSPNLGARPEGAASLAELPALLPGLWAVRQPNEPWSGSEPVSGYLLLLPETGLLRLRRRGTRAKCETGRWNGRGEPGIQAGYPAEGRGRQPGWGSPAPGPRPARPRPRALEFLPQALPLH